MHFYVLSIFKRLSFSS